MDTPAFLRPICLVVGILAILAGGLGMAASFPVLASRSMADIMAGSSGFVAGAILIGSGLLSLTMLVLLGDRLTDDRRELMRVRWTSPSGQTISLLEEPASVAELRVTSHGGRG